MNKEYVKDLLEKLYDDVEDIRLMVADIPDMLVRDIELEIEGTPERKGILYYIRKTLKNIEDIQKEMEYLDADD